MKRACLVVHAALVVACARPSAPPELPPLTIEEVPPPIDESCGDGCVRASQCAGQKSEEERFVIAENCFLRCRPNHPQHALQARWTKATAVCVQLPACSDYVSCVHRQSARFNDEPRCDSRSQMCLF